jgi:hypothetical protein
MTINAGGRSAFISALILATGIFVCFAGPSPAAAGADDNAVVDSKSASSEADGAAGEPTAVRKYVRHGSRHWKRHAHRKSGGLALKSAAARKAHATDIASDKGGISTAIPPSVANANAQVASADTPVDTPADTPAVDTPAGNARAMSARANDILQAPADQPAGAQPVTDAQVVTTDQLNDVDRTLQTSPPSEPTMTVATAETAASRDENSSWDQASLIGKLFMGFGALLTVASAARMLIG